MTKTSIFAPLDWFISTQHRIEAANTERDLSRCASMLDGYEMQELPEHRQTYLCTLYSEAVFRVRGSFQP